MQYAIAMAHAAGVPVLLNPAPAQHALPEPLPPELLAQVSVLVPNETEAAVLLNLSHATAFDAAVAATRLRERGARTVIITLGASGVQLATDGISQHFTAPKVHAIDTTGAGDTFIGAYAAALCDGADLSAAVEYAQRAAALSVTKIGAIAAMPRRDELLPAKPF